MIETIANFNPILALALFMPVLTSNKYLQYLLPVSVYVVMQGLWIEQIGLYATCLLATWTANNLSTVKSLIVTALGWHVFNLYSLALHPDSTYLGALQYDTTMILSTALYLLVFKMIHTTTLLMRQSQV